MCQQNSLKNYFKKVYIPNNFEYCFSSKSFEINAGQIC